MNLLLSTMEGEGQDYSLLLYYEHYNDCTPSELVLSGQWSQEIRSIKDIFQFYYEDMKMLTRDTDQSNL
ncbi:MAG: hypothetical protein ACRD8Z_00615, partial [Nitrososphaeraceae archaeon]